MWRVTPPGYVHEYGDSSAIRTSPHSIRTGRGAGAVGSRAAAAIIAA